MRSTENYELNLLDAEDFVNREVLNENTEKIDEVLKTLEEPEHDTTKQTEVEELATGESLKVALRKLAKAVSDYISHKADQVAHITAEERTAWTAKLGAEKIAANLTTDTEGMVLAAAMGKTLKEQIDTNASAISTLNSNQIKHKQWYISPGETLRILCREAGIYGNLVLFSTFMAIPGYKTIFFASSGNGNNTNEGQCVVITKLLESSVVTVSRLNQAGCYNIIEITNNGSYGVYLHANTLYGTEPTNP